MIVGVLLLAFASGAASPLAEPSVESYFGAPEAGSADDTDDDEGPKEF